MSEAESRLAFTRAVENAAESTRPVAYQIGSLFMLIPNEVVEGKRLEILLTLHDFLCLVVRNHVDPKQPFDGSADKLWYRNNVQRPAMNIARAMSDLGLETMSEAERRNATLIQRYCV